MKRENVIALSGGVGGAKLADGLVQAVGDGRLTVVVNTGDDFNHLGLHISPDVDTALYTLGGLANPETGWGRRDETWTFMAALAQLGGESWFRLGDGDLAIHVERTRRLAAGETLSAIIADFARRLGISAHIVPMSDQALRTRVHCDEGVFDFQDYFVRLQCRRAVGRFFRDGQRFDHGAAASAPALAAAQVPAAMGVPLPIEYRPRRATKLSGSTSLRSVRTGHTEGKGCTAALPGSSASHCCQAVCRKAR